MVKKTKAESLATRNLLLDTAERLFYESGVSKTSLAEIANACGLTRGAIYWHFKNKSDLLQAMMERVRLPSETILDASLDEAPLDTLREYAAKMLRDTATNPRRRRVLTVMIHRCEHNEEVKSLTVRQQSAILDCNNHIRSCLTSAIQQGLLPEKLDSDKATTMLLGLLFGTMSNWLFLPDSFDLEKDAVDIVDAYFVMLKNSPSLLKN